MTYLRRLCLDEGWPNGNLNLPRPILTEKAFPEDELVVLPAISHERRSAGEGELAAVIEKRFGKRNNIEIELPIASIDSGFGRQTGVGDIQVAVKRVLSANRAGTRIASGGLEVAFPTGDPARNLGEGTTRFAPFVAAGFAFGPSSLQTMIGLELPRKQPWKDKVLEYNVYAPRKAPT